MRIDKVGIDEVGINPTQYIYSFQMGGAKHFGEQPCNLEVAVQLTLEASTCVLYLSLILGIDRILLCLI